MALKSRPVNNKNMTEYGYEALDFISVVKRSAIIEFIRTKNVYFFEGINPLETIQFCKSKNIDSIPSNDGISKYRLDGEKFVIEKIQPFEKLKITDNIFDYDVLDSFTEDSNLKFVYWNSKLVGVLHFSDYNRTTTYVYLFGLISELENNIRSIFCSLGKSNEDLLNYLKEKMDRSNEKNKIKIVSKYMQAKKNHECSNGKLDHFQVFDLSSLVSYFNRLIKTDILNLSKVKDEIVDLRNSIMHNKSLIHAIDNEKSPYHFDFNSFIQFRETIKSLFGHYYETRDYLEKRNSE